MIEFGYVMSFWDSKYLNPIQIRYGSKNYGYFIGILIIDPNRPGSEKNRSKPEPKIYKLPIGSKCLGSEGSGPERNRSRPERNRSGPDPKTRTLRPSWAAMNLNIRYGPSGVVKVLCKICILLFCEDYPIMQYTKY